MSFVSTGTCPTNLYVKEIKANGDVICANIPYHWGLGCSTGQYIERISSTGVPTCKNASQLISNITCPSGEFVYQNSNGVFSCRGHTDSNVYGKACPTEQVLRGFDSSGNPLCEAKTSGGSNCTIQQWGWGGWGGGTITLQHAQIRIVQCGCTGHRLEQCFNGAITAVNINCQDGSCGGGQ